MKKLLIVVLIVGLVLVSIVGYFGFVPGVSSLLGSNAPRDLGAAYQPEDIKKVDEKLSQSIVPVGPNADPYEQLKASGSTKVDVTLTPQEFAAHTEQVNPVSDVQISIEGDTVKVSGRIDRARIPAFVKTLGIVDVTDSEILAVVDKYLPTDAAFYLEGTGKGKNNKVDLTLTKAEIGRLSLPVDKVGPMVESYLNLVINQAPGYSVKTISVKNGQLHFVGTATKQIPQY